MWILGLKELIVAINFHLCYMYVTVTRACRLSRFHPNSVSLVRKYVDLCLTVSKQIHG